MLEKFGELAEEGAETAEASEELSHVLESAAEADQKVHPASGALQAWTASSYRSLRALIMKQDPTLAHTGLVQVTAGGASEWVAPQNAAAWEAHQRELSCPEEERGDGEDERKVVTPKEAPHIPRSSEDVFVRTSNIKKYTVGKHEVIERASQPPICGVVVRLIADDGDSGAGTVTVRLDAAIDVTVNKSVKTAM